MYCYSVPKEIIRPLPRNSEKREGGKFSGPARALRVEALNFLEFSFLFVQAKRKERKMKIQ
jgi:hypothetical protein